MSIKWIQHSTAQSYAVVGYNAIHNTKCWGIAFNFSGEFDEKHDVDVMDYIRSSIREITREFVEISFWNRGDDVSTSDYDMFLFLTNGIMFFEEEDVARKVFAIFDNAPVYSSAMYAALYDANGICIDENT